VTEVQAKELIIDGMNYAAYKETDRSLFVEDKNRLFGAEHFALEPHAFDDGRPSPWGTGEQFESRMADLLRWAVALGSSQGDYQEAFAVLKRGDHYLNRIISKAGF